MLRNYLKVAFRNLRRQRGYTALNVIGLAIGLAGAFFILLWTQDELRHDRFHDEGDRLYVAKRHMTFTNGDIVTAQSVTVPAAAVLEDVEFDTATVESDDVVGAIVERSAEHDITVIGSSRESLLQQLVFGAIPEEVGRRAEHTVIMAKRNLGLSSRLTRWFRGHRRNRRGGNSE